MLIATSRHGGRGPRGGVPERIAALTLFPVITGQTGPEPIFQQAADLDLEPIESRTLDGHRARHSRGLISVSDVIV
ncbi:hypothetical protein ACQEVC_27910 [Plantactinospora sp. CA-294935]|uniref:hypothetical protein n=1 Tax=Plantactinospora sp. CA-294935 TaxID=3240012 RepID=UPI003D8ACA29